VSVAVFLAELRRRGIEIGAEGGQLRCSAPAGVMSLELREQIRQHKAAILEFLEAARALAGQQRAIVPLQTRGTRDPVFAVGGHNGDVFCYRALAAHLGEDQPFFGLQAPGVDGDSEPLARVEDLSAYFAAQIRAFRPEGPLVIAGYCTGGTIALELARQLLEGGAAVRGVALIAGPHPSWYRFLPQLRHRVTSKVRSACGHARALASLAHAERGEYLRDVRRRRQGERNAHGASAGDPEVIRRARVEAVTLGAVRRFRPRPFEGRVCQFLPSREWSSGDALLARRWRGLARDIEEYCGPDGGRGDRILLEPYVRALAEQFRLFRESSSGERREPIPTPGWPVPTSAI
jgi:thioesterase domain-containing protein